MPSPAPRAGSDFDDADSFMTEDEYKQLKATLQRITEHQRTFIANAHAAADDFSTVERGLVDLLAAALKRINDRIDGQLRL